MSNIKLGTNSTIFKVGSSSVSKIYLGSTSVWESESGPQALTFTSLVAGCSPRWQLGNIPANTTSLRLICSGSHRGGTFSNVEFTIPIGTNSGDNTHKITGPTNMAYSLTIEHYGASLPASPAAGSSIPGYFRTITRNGITSFFVEHTFTADIEALDASSNVIGIINSTSWIKDDCDD